MVIENMWSIANSIHNGLSHPPLYNLIRVDDRNVHIPHLVPTITTPMLSGSLLCYVPTALPGLDVLTASRQSHTVQKSNTHQHQQRQPRGYLKRVSENGDSYFTHPIPNRLHSRIAIEYLNCYDYSIYNNATGWTVFPANNIPVYKTPKMVHSQTHLQTNMTHSVMNLNTNQNNGALFPMQYNVQPYQTYYEQKQATCRSVKLPKDTPKWPYGWSGTVSYENQICLLKSVCLSDDTYSSSDSDEKFTFVDDMEIENMINNLIDESLVFLRNSSYHAENMPKICFSWNGVYHFDNICFCDFCAVSEYRQNGDSFLELYDQKEHMIKYKFDPFEIVTCIRNIMVQFPLSTILYDEPYGIEAFKADYGEDTDTTKTFRESVWKNGSIPIKNIQTQQLSRPLVHTQQIIQNTGNEIVFNVYRDQQYLNFSLINEFQHFTAHGLTQHSIQSHCNNIFNLTSQTNTNSIQNRSGKRNYTSRLSVDENARNRMAEFVAIGPLKDTWFSELLKDFGAKPRMKYTNNFIYPEHVIDGYKDENVPIYTYVSSEDLQTFYVPEPLYMNNLNQDSFYKYQ